MRVFAVLALAVSSLPVFAQADWRFVQPDATLVGSLKVQPLLNSPLLAAVIAEGQAGQTAGVNDAQAAQVAMAMAMAKGMLGGIQEIRFSLIDNGTQQPDAVAVVTGTLDEAMVGMLAKDKASLKRIDANTLLIGTPAALEAAAARMSQTAAVLQPRALANMEALAAYDIWLSGKMPDVPVAAGLNLNLKSLALGLSMHENFEAQLAMEATNANQAESLVKTAHEAESAQPTQYRGMLQSFVEGHTAHFRVNVPQALVLDAIRTQGKGIQPLASNGTSSASPLVIEPPKPPRRSTIVIEGLDSGTKEIPLK